MSEIKDVSIWVLLGLTAIVICLFYPAHHVSYDQQAIQAIVGEASNQSHNTMVCVAHGIRNRGNLKGVYGVNASHNDSEPEWVWLSARDAWNESLAEKDTVNGAKNWGTFEDLNKLGVTAYKANCGDLYFY